MKNCCPLPLASRRRRRKRRGAAFPLIWKVTELGLGKSGMTGGVMILLGEMSSFQLESLLPEWPSNRENNSRLKTLAK